MKQGASEGQNFSTMLLALLLCVGLDSACASPLIFKDATLIDGTGTKPRTATVVIDSQQIKSIDRKFIADDFDADATIIDARGKYLLPGFIDSNVHASIYGNSKRRETVVKYAGRIEDLVREFVQRQLKHGVTTIRDSYGALEPLMKVRDEIARGEVIGPRMLVAGNIVGWGGPFSMTFSLMQESELTLFQQKWNDYIAQGVGEELMDMEPAELRIAIDRYIDKGPDFIKFGGTSHFGFPSLIGFSPRTQKVIVDASHARDLIAETHATSPEGLRMALKAGIDLVQHPEILSRDYSDELLNLLISKKAICGIRSNTLTGEPWQAHLKNRSAAKKAIAKLPPAKTSAERRARDKQLETAYAIERRNAERLIKAGCTVTIATDNYQGRAPEFRKEDKPIIQEAGIGSVLAIEGLVELGMNEMQALVAATRNGAMAAGALDSYGTIEVGKSVDLVLLNANPLKDISNIRKLHAVVARGKVIDTTSLPEQRIFDTSPVDAP
ncbi:MAG: amidohydrolase family protein [Pseudomonadales bacterium]